MANRITMCGALALLAIGVVAAARAASPAPPIRGLHLAAPKPEDLDLAIRFIQEALPKEGVNVLVLEFDYRYQFSRHPEVVEDGALSRDDVKKLVAACRKAGVKLIPQINCLGHQPAGRGLLKGHPEFDESPGKPSPPGYCCRSYCPLAPGLHAVIFDLLDEIAGACESNLVHAGMDEVFILGDDACPRCRGKDKAQLFAGEVRALHDHLAAGHRLMWMWGDRFLDGATTGVGKWEGSVNQTFPAINLVPRDIMICDWHYESAVPTAAHFAVEGFPVLACPWRKPEVALAQLASIESIRAHATAAIANRMQGVLQTTWGGFAPFAHAYFGDQPPANTRVIEALVCFRALFRELRAAGE